jgi:hypothetical protein
MTSLVAFEPLMPEERVWGPLLERAAALVSESHGLLSLPGLKSRIGDLLSWLAANPWQLGSETSTVKIDALEALHYVAITGPVERARFMAMTGLPARTARRVLASLLDYGVLVSETNRAPVRLAVPLRSLRFLFPRLWPEAEADTEPGVGR